MAKGKIKKWVSGKGFGFIADDEGGPDVFFHINENKSLEDNKGSLRPDARVSFEKHLSEKGPRAYNVRLESGSSNAHPKSSPQKRHTSSPGLPSQISNSFHNPYTFVPSPPRRNIQQNLFAGDFDPVARGLTHDTLKADL